MSSVNPIVTYVRDPDLVPPTTPVYLVSGSIALNLAPGDISIGAVELKDNDSDRRVHVDPYDAAVPAEMNVMRVQNVDSNGDILQRDDILNLDAGVDVLIAGQAQTQATITALLNAQGTQTTAGLATAANQATGNSTLSLIQDGIKAVNDTSIAILNEQGTLATSANQATGNATLTAIDNSVKDGNSTAAAIMNHQGSLATWVNQGEELRLLTAIHEGQGTMANSAAQSTANLYLATLSSQIGRIESQGTLPGIVSLFSNKTTPGASSNVDVSAWMHHTVQHVISGSVVVQLRTSLDGSNWHVEDETNMPDLFNLYGKTKFISANVVYINGTISTMLMSGN